MDDKKRKYANFLLTRCLSMNAGEPLVLGYLKKTTRICRHTKR